MVKTNDMVGKDCVRDFATSEVNRVLFVCVKSLATHAIML